MATNGLSLREMLMGDDIDMQHKLQNMLIVASLAGCSVSLIVSLAMGFGLAGNLVSLAALLTLSATFFVSVVLRKKTAASYMITTLMNMVLFPLMFIFDGGVYSAMPIWLAFGLIFPWLVMDGAGCYVMFVLNLAAVLGCFALQVFHPELITMPEGDLTLMTVLDLTQTIIVVPLVVGITIRYQGREFSAQQAKMEQQEKKMLEAMRAADRANEAKTSFLASMSHEIRTPINAVLGMDEMILRESSDESIISYASNIQSAGHSLLSVVNDVLDLSKIESGKLELLNAEYSTQQLMNDCYSMIIMRAEKKNLLLEIKNDPQLPSRLCGDEVRLRQVILNLMTNAVKYTSAGEVLMRVGFEKTGEDEILLKISVHDTGMGISQENQLNLFKAFRRLDEMSNRNIEGTGLGLTITKQLTDMMGGSISVRSTLGSGSEFTVEIPQRVADHAPVGVFIENRRAAVTQQKHYHERFQAPDAHILVVDDVKLNIDVMRGLLKPTRIQTDAAYSGRECLALVSRTHYDMIFMDHLMPDMDGIETLRRMRELTGTPNDGTPVIALTANAMAGAKEKYGENGFSDYLAKPVQSEKLEELLLEFLPPELIKPVQETAAELVTPAMGIPELDTAAGIRACGGDERLYRRVLSMADMAERAERLDEEFSRSGWKEYEALCCGIRSAAQAIGGLRVQRLAERVVGALNSGNMTVVNLEHPGFAAQCRSLDTACAAYIRRFSAEGEKY